MKKNHKLFLKMYVARSETVLTKFQHIGEVKLFDYIVRNCHKQTLRWTITKSVRESAAKELGLSEPSINRYLASMVSPYEVLIKVDRGTYEINKKYIDSGLEPKE